jgi:hypothetical protein
MPEVNYSVDPNTGLMLLRTSGRKDWRRCPWYGYMRWVEGWSPKRPPTWSIFGGAYHKAMEVLYPVGSVEPNQFLEEAQQTFIDELKGEIRKIGVDIFEEEYERQEREAEDRERSVTLVPAHELGVIMLEEYVKWIERTQAGDGEWEVIHTEQPFQIDVPYPKSWGKRFEGQTLVVYCGTWDNLSYNRRTKEYWLWDWKTCKSLPDHRVLDMDDQRGTYLWVAKEVLVHKGLLSPKDHLAGIVFQYAKKQLPDDRPCNAVGEALNKDGTVSKRQPVPRFLRLESARSPEQVVRQARRVQKEAVQYQQWIDDPEMIYKNQTHECIRCPLYDMCEAHESGDDWELIRDEMYVQRDPFADHREAMNHGGIEL